MSREKLAALLLLILISISAWNIYKVGSLSRDIGTLLNKAEQAAQASNFDAAGKCVDKALTLWLSAESYTHIFIRHPEIDSCTDIFYEALEAVNSKSTEDIEASLAKLRYHIESIASMERISFGSVF